MMLLCEKKISTSWYSRPKSAEEGVVITLPNPANNELRARIAGYHQVILRLKSNLEQLKELKVCQPSLSIDEYAIVESVSSGAVDGGLGSMISRAEEMPNVMTTHEKINALQSKLNVIQRYVSIKTHELQYKFAQAVDVCWKDSNSDSEDDVLEPFALVCAKAGRRLSFNLEKGDEILKTLRALATDVTKLRPVIEGMTKN